MATYKIKEVKVEDGNAWYYINLASDEIGKLE